MLSVVVFDVDGTLAETERDGHRPAFNRAFADHGLPYHWNVAEYGQMLQITGGRRRLQRYLTERGRADAEQLAAELHATKTALFRAWVRTGPVQARPGVTELISDLRSAGVRLAVATTGRRAWVAPLLARLFDTDLFAAVVTGDDVEHLKPAPDLYLRALGKLGVRATDALAIEDAPNGLASARAAGLPAWWCQASTTEPPSSPAPPLSSTGSPPSTPRAAQSPRSAGGEITPRSRRHDSLVTRRVDGATGCGAAW